MTFANARAAVSYYFRQGSTEQVEALARFEAAFAADNKDREAQRESLTEIERLTAYYWKLPNREQDAARLALQDQLRELA